MSLSSLSTSLSISSVAPIPPSTALVTVLRVLGDHPHSTVETIAPLVRSELGAVSTQAVYDVLAAFATAGLVRKIQPAGSAARFELRVGDNHHHVVCRSCGQTSDVDCLTAARPCLEPANETGFVIDEAEIVFWGLCLFC